MISSFFDHKNVDYSAAAAWQKISAFGDQPKQSQVFSEGHQTEKNIIFGVEERISSISLYMFFGRHYHYVISIDRYS